MLNSTIAIVDSVRTTSAIQVSHSSNHGNSVRAAAVPAYVIEAIHYMTDFVTQKNCPVRGKSRCWRGADVGGGGQMLEGGEGQMLEGGPGRGGGQMLEGGRCWRGGGGQMLVTMQSFIENHLRQNMKTHKYAKT